MKPETPAEGILKTNDFGNSKWYRVVCGCGQPDHELNFEVEADDTGVNVNTYATVKTDYWDDTLKKRYNIENPYLQELDWAIKDIINGFINRLKLTWAVWARGYIRCETTVIMSEQQALNYAETLKQAVKDVKEFRTVKNHEQRPIYNEGDCV